MFSSWSDRKLVSLQTVSSMTAGVFVRFCSLICPTCPEQCLCGRYSINIHWMNKWMDIMKGLDLKKRSRNWILLAVVSSEQGTWIIWIFFQEDSFCSGRRETQVRKRKIRVNMRAEAIGNGWEGNVRERQVQSSEETLNCGQYAEQIGRDYLKL